VRQAEAKTNGFRFWHAHCQFSGGASEVRDEANSRQNRRAYDLVSLSSGESHVRPARLRPERERRRIAVRLFSKAVAGAQVTHAGGELR